MFVYPTEFWINLLSISKPAHYSTTRFVSLFQNPREKLRRKCVGIFYKLYVLFREKCHTAVFHNAKPDYKCSTGNVRMLHLLLIIYIICFFAFTDDYWWLLHSARTKMTDAIIYLSKANGGKAMLLFAKHLIAGWITSVGYVPRLSIYTNILLKLSA